jgi:tRNA modification GTPase
VETVHEDTIAALSSGQGRAAIALIRASGAKVRFVIETMVGVDLQPRQARLVSLRQPRDGSLIDRCVALFFPGPASATGEDLLELHVHGSVAVIDAVLGVLTAMDGIRLAEPGEFTRRALENGKLDLLQVEALGDLLCAETAAQLRQAQRQLSGELGRLVSAWRQLLIEARAKLEADLDFSDESDVQDGLPEAVRGAVADVQAAIRAVLGRAQAGRRIRDGASVVVVGAPNAGKSMLMNALAGRDVAIVSSIPGTTRDVLESPLDIGGWPVVLVDTAGLRESADVVELEGIRRARVRIGEADVILSVSSHDVPETDITAPTGVTMLRVGTKADIETIVGSDVSVSSLTGAGLDELRMLIAAALGKVLAGEPALVARARQREVLSEVAQSLERVGTLLVPELMAEELRHASFVLGRLAGQTDLDSVLDSLFHGFCIGK